MNRYFPVAILLTSFSSFSGLTVAIAKERVSLDYQNVSESLDIVEKTLKAAETNPIGYNSELDRLVENNVRALRDASSHNSSDFVNQELNAIAQASLVTAVLEGELKIETTPPPEPTPEPIQGVAKATIAIVKEFEGFRSSAYLDTDGTPVIGYGQSKINGRKVRLGDRTTETAAHAALVAELEIIQKEILSTVKVDLNDNQLGAVASLSFNTGVNAIKRSTLVRKLNQEDYSGAANEFLRWNKADVRGMRVVMNGLSRRRARERELFLTPVDSQVSDRSL